MIDEEALSFFPHLTEIKRERAKKALILGYQHCPRNYARQ
jgi:hypothetical protein